MTAASLLLFLPSLTSTTLAAAAACLGPRTPGELRDALWGEGSGYDRRTRPGVAMAAAGNATSDYNPWEAPPDVARVQLHILSLRELNQKQNEFQMNIFLRQEWVDHRLKLASASEGGCFADGDYQGFPESDLNEIWRPDLYIQNEIDVDNSIADSFWITPSGDVVQVRALLITLACNMDFSNLPYDEQTCGLRVGSWRDDARSVTVEFSEGVDPVTLATKNEEDKIDIEFGDSVEWDIVSVGGKSPDGDATTQAWSSVEFSFQLRRNTSYYSHFVLTPTILFVVIGWVSFFLSRYAAPARVTMSIVVFLANSNFLSSQLKLLPRLGNDVWLLRFLTVSLFFNFYAVVEYAVCNYLCRIESRIEGGRKRARELVVKRSQREQSRQTDDCLENNDLETEHAVTKDDLRASGFCYKVDLWLLKKDGNMIFKDQHVDIFSRIAYPIGYAITCAVMFS